MTNAERLRHLIRLQSFVIGSLAIASAVPALRPPARAVATCGGGSGNGGQAWKAAYGTSSISFHANENAPLPSLLQHNTEAEYQ